MDKLDKIFQMQAELNNYISQNHALENKYSQSEWIQKDILAIMSELGEVLDEVNYKWWKSPKAVDYLALKEEIVDVLHFFVCMCLNAGMTSEELFEIYLQKNEENLKRQKGLSDKKDYRP